MPNSDLPGWSGNVRCVRGIVAPTDKVWVVVPHDTTPTVSLCPCCGGPLASKRTARLAETV
ncbi:MAG: hypothetical protein JOY71_11305 [Acetobacteraceae bacterium]|nr:hypothetical protein [Acetobacteraceae bacterium]MBV8591536.1 hypothetical protein [Acetobacteraceae bacterium]